MLVLLAFESGAIKEGSRFLTIEASANKVSAIKVCTVKACAIKASSGSRHQGVCRFWKQVKGASTPHRVQILFIAAVSGRAVMGARGC